MLWEKGLVIAPSEQEIEAASEKELIRLLGFCKKRKREYLPLKIFKHKNLSDRVLFAAACALKESVLYGADARKALYELSDRKYYDALKKIYQDYRASFPAYWMRQEDRREYDIKKYLTVLAKDYGDKEAAAELKKIEEGTEIELAVQAETQKEGRRYAETSSPRTESARLPDFFERELTGFKSCNGGGEVFRTHDGKLVNENGTEVDPLGIYFPVGGKSYSDD